MLALSSVTNGHNLDPARASHRKLGQPACVVNAKHAASVAASARHQYTVLNCLIAKHLWSLHALQRFLHPQASGHEEPSARPPRACGLARMPVARLAVPQTQGACAQTSKGRAKVTSTHRYRSRQMRDIMVAQKSEHNQQAWLTMAIITQHVRKTPQAT